MSKKKNTLKDLDEFLKQQAASLVSPPKLSEPSAEDTTLKESPVMQSQPREVSFTSVLEDLVELSEKEGTDFHKKFYDLIIHTIELNHHQIPEEKILINTALYLKSGQRWKEAISDYWRNREDA